MFMQTALIRGTDVISIDINFASTDTNSVSNFVKKETSRNQSDHDRKLETNKGRGKTTHDRPDSMSGISRNSPAEGTRKRS